MKSRNLLTLFSLAAIFGLAGCGQSPEPTQRPASATSAPKQDKQAQPHPDPNAPTTKQLLTYYSAHLDEALAKWHECEAKGLQNVTADEKPTCVAAGNAWHNQPYRPKK